MKEFIKNVTNRRPRGSDAALARPASRQVKRLFSPDHLPLYYLTAFVLTLVIECLSRRSVGAGLLFPFENPLAFLVNMGIILLTLHLSMLCPCRVPVLALIGTIWLGLGVADCVLLSNRVTPLTAVDFSVLFNVITIMNIYLTMPQMVLICVSIAAAVAVIVILFIKVPRRPVFWKRLGLSAAGTVAGLALSVAVAFGTGHLSIRFANLADAYRQYGFTYCFTMSVVDRGIAKPDEYSEGVVTIILNELPAPADNPVQGSDREDRAPNVIIVQLESFFDVRALSGVTYTKDPIPNFTALCEAWPSGSFMVPVIGAGTVNTEFEVLTGMRVSDFGTGEYPYKTVMNEKTCETVAYDLLHSGYRTHAIHNHQGTFYARDEVYPHMGFETFTPIEYFLHPEYNVNTWAKDSILTDEILYLMADTEEPDLVFAVSVQGHGKYPVDYTPTPGDVQASGGVSDPETLSRLNYYLSQLYEMDAFVGELTKAVMELEEDTVLVFYGDHLPSFSQDECLTLTTSDFETPYLIVANYDLDMSDATGEPLYAYQLFPYIMELIGNDEGVINRFHRTLKGSEDYLTYLSVLEYDILYGACYAYGGLGYPVMDMKLGSRDIRVTGYRIEEDNTVYVTGDNFTPYSVIAIDGNQKETVYVDEHTLKTARGLFADQVGSVSVRQVTDKGEVLSESVPFAVNSR